MTTLENRPTAAPDCAAQPTPDSAAAWLARATEVRHILASDAAARDQAAESPYAEVTLLKNAGLVTLLGPTAEGGGGQEWPLAYQVVREVSAGDGSIGQLLGYHYLWFWAARLVGTTEQITAVEADATRNRWFFGGAVNPRDTDVQIRDEGDHIVYSGRKTFSTGSKVSDVTVLEGVLEGTDTHVFAIVPSQQPGITFHDDWDNIGQRLTESGPAGSAASSVQYRFTTRDGAAAVIRDPVLGWGFLPVGCVTRPAVLRNDND